MFHLARQMEQRGWLERIFTTYPRFKVSAEPDVPQEKIACNWPIYTAELALLRRGVQLSRSDAFMRLRYADNDRHLKRHLPECDVFVALSQSGLAAGLQAQKRGGTWICDRGSTHADWSHRVVGEELARFGAAPPTPPITLERERSEYAAADRIVVPSRFVANTFIEEGIPAEKLRICPYGANRARFKPVGAPDPEAFEVLFVGQVGARKGIPLLLEAFARVKHPRKRLKIIGGVMPELKAWLSERRFDDVEFLGLVPNTELAAHYSSAHVFALASIEEGLAMVIGEALACGVPVVATANTGVEDILTDEVEGFVVRDRTIEAFSERLQQLADDPALRARMSAAALTRVTQLGGWDTYGENYAGLITELRG
jgi:glycosyltransferase involved in cell wall biosynthesis